MDILHRGKCGQECLLTCERPEVIVFWRGKCQRATGEWGRERELVPRRYWHWASAGAGSRSCLERGILLENCF